MPSSFIDNPNVIRFFQHLRPSFKLSNKRKLNEDDDLYDVKDQNIGDCYYYGRGVIINHLSQLSGILSQLIMDVL